MSNEGQTLHLDLTQKVLVKKVVVGYVVALNIECQLTVDSHCCFNYVLLLNLKKKKEKKGKQRRHVRHGDWCNFHI